MRSSLVSFKSGKNILQVDSAGTNSFNEIFAVVIVFKRKETVNHVIRKYTKNPKRTPPTNKNKTTTTTKKKKQKNIQHKK